MGGRNGEGISVDRRGNETGWLKKLAYALLFTALLAMMAACEKQNGEPGAKAASPTPPAAGSTAPSAVTATPSTPLAAETGGTSNSPGKERGVAESLIELSICQLNRGKDGGENNGESDCIVSYGTERMLILPAMPLPDRAEQYALYMEEVYFFVKFGTNDEKTLERLTSQIKAQGGTLKLEKERSMFDSSNIRYKGSVTGIQNETVLSFGDIPPITLKRSDRKLTYEIEPALAEKKEMLLLQSDFGGQLLMPEREKEAVLVFSESIRTDKVKITAYESDPSVTTPTGKWLDDRRLAIAVPDGATEWHVSMENVFSVDGSYFGKGGDGKYVKLRKLSERVWRHFPSGEKVLESAYAKYYDFILFSPDKKKALGIIELGGPIADEGGRYYAVVLDRSGQTPVVVRSPMHFGDILLNMPLAWLDEERIAYVEYNGWKLYDIPSGQTTTLAAESELNGAYFNAMAYDAHDRDFSHTIRSKPPSATRWM